jgi:hypothetical protein
MFMGASLIVNFPSTSGLAAKLHGRPAGASYPREERPTPEEDRHFSTQGCVTVEN